MIVENLRYMLYQYDPDRPFYLGSKFKPYVNQGYMSGGAGYVLSKEALRRFVPNRETCLYEDDKDVEDVGIGRCMETLNVTAGDTRDSNGLGRMFVFPLNDHLLSGIPEDFWYWKYLYYPTNMNNDCCSNRTISFHYVEPEHMRMLDFLIYDLKPFGLKYEDVLPIKSTHPRLKLFAVNANKKWALGGQNSWQ